MASPLIAQSSDPVETPTFKPLDTVIERLNQHKKKWVETPINERIALLRRTGKATLAQGAAWAAACAAAKGGQSNSHTEGEEWLAGPMTTLRNIRLLIRALEAGGQPKPKKIWQRANGQHVAQVFPDQPADKLMFAGFQAEVWMQPGKPTSQGRIYQQPNHQSGEGKIALVLGAGNVSSIGPMDALYKLFVDNEVVLLKTNPVNAYVGEFIERSLAPLVEDGFFALVNGGASEGEYLCQHPLVDSIHITGSHHTHDAIVWGEDAAQAKQSHRKKLDKEITSELGCVTPIMVVPGPWSAADIAFQARHVASMVAHNGSFNCNAAKALVLARGWDKRQQFLDALHAILAKTPPRTAYYPGAQQRYDAFLEHYPNAKALAERTDNIVPWTILPDVPAVKGEYALENEAFCGVLAEINLDAAEPHDFLQQAVEFANHTLWGTLSCGMLIHPKTMKQHAAAIDTAIGALRYGGIGINAWPGVIYGLVSTTWGAFPGHPLEDIESGRGVVHNAFLFDYPEKSVLKAPFRIQPTPAWFADHRNLKNLAEKLTQYEGTGASLKIPGIIAAALKG